MVKRKSRARRRQFRPLRSVIVIASEGKETEKRYFDALNMRFRDANIKQIRRRTTRTAPSQVLEDLLEFKDNPDNTYAPETPFWLVIDTDGRKVDELKAVAKQAEDNDCLLAESNPCFEVWLILHYGKIQDYKGLAGDVEIGGCNSAIRFLKQRLDTKYHKTRYDAETYVTEIERAIANARAGDSNPNSPLLDQVGSRVYKLAQSIIDSSPNHTLN